MLDVRPFRPGDAALFAPQHAQALEMVSIGDWRAMVEEAALTGPAWTGFDAGRVLGCAGFSLRWRGRAHAWCVLGAGIPRTAWVGIHRAVVARMAQLPELGVVRLEAEARLGFLPGHRWLDLLGFEREGLMRCYGPGGEDFTRFARITL